MRVAITGGAGFVGANLVKYLLKKPNFISDIIVVDDLSTGTCRNLADVPDVTFHEGSILDDTLLDITFDNIDAVVHLAALPSVPRSIDAPLASHDANSTGTLKVLEAVRRTGRDIHVIVASSSSVYGASPELPKREDHRPSPMSPYAVSKLSAESYARAYHVCHDLSVLIFRFFNIFGPLQPAGHAYAAVVPAFIDQCLRGVPLTLFGDGTQSRDFTYVDSVCAVIADAIRRKVVSPEPVNLAFGSRIPLIEVIEKLEDLFSRSLEIAYLPERMGDVRHSQADGSSLAELFPDVRPTQFETGLTETVAWFRSIADHPYAAEVNSKWADVPPA